MIKRSHLTRLNYIPLFCPHGDSLIPHQNNDTITVIKIKSKALKKYLVSFTRWEG